MKHDGEAFYKCPERPLLDTVKFALAVAAALNHRSTSVPEVPTQPLLPQHPDKRSQQRDQETRVKESQGCDNPRGRAIPRLRNGGFFVWKKRWVEAEKNRSQVRFRRVAGVRFEFRLDVKDEGGANRGEQAGLIMESILRPNE